MEIIPTIKNLLIDSLAGISYRNLPFILVQFISAILALVAGARLLKLKEGKRSLVSRGIAFTLVFIIAFTSVPLSIVSGFIVLAFLFSKNETSFDGKMSIILFSFAAASGHLILLLITLLFMWVYSLVFKSKDND